MLIAQLTDLHIAAPGTRTLGGWDATARAQAAADWLTRLETRPDLVIMTGDVTQNGEAIEYETLERIFTPTGLRFRLIPGNHDARQPMWDRLMARGWVDRVGDHVLSVDEIGDLTVIGLDTLDTGRVGGALCAQRLDWLAERLKERASTPVLIAQHHPPIDSGIVELDEMALVGREVLAEIVAQHTNIVAVISGHLHRPLCRAWAGTIAFTAPSSGRQFALSFDPHARPAWSEDQPAAALHLWSPSPHAVGDLVSHVVTISGGDATL